MHFRVMRWVVLTFLVGLVGLVCCPSSVFAFSATINTAENVEVDVGLMNQDGTGSSVVGEDINVVSECRFGYDLVVEGPVDNNLYLNGNASNNQQGEYITPADGESLLKDSPNTWGFSLTSNTANGVFSPINSDGATLKTVNETVTSESSIDDTFPIYYGVAISSELAAGSYSMQSNLKITYQLTMSPRCVEYSIEYGGNGASAGGMVSNGEVLKHLKVVEEDKIDLYAPNYSKTGYGFLGWSPDTGAGAKMTDSNPNNDPILYGPNETIVVTDDLLAFADNNDIVTLHATWIPSEGNLQEWTGCDSLSATKYDATTGKLKMTNELTENSGNYAKSVTALTDTRDNEVYAIARLTDGQCWMIENLRLNLENVTFSKYNTNHPTDYFIERASGLSPRTVSSWGSSYDPDYYYDVSNMNRELAPSHDLELEVSSWYSYGAYYKYPIASAGRYQENIASGDICPIGWHLPVVSQNSQYSSFMANYNNDYALLAHTMGDDTRVRGSELFRSAPNNTVLAGGFNYTDVEATWPYIYDILSRGKSGQYAVSLFNGGYDGSDQTTVFKIFSSSIGHNSFYKYISESVRCISGFEREATIVYDANGGENAPASVQSTSGNGLYEITVTNGIPTRTGYTFVAWADSEGNEYHGGDTFTTDRDEDTLYAVWTNNACNPNATTISGAVCLQDVNSSVRASMTSKTNYTLVDARDNQSYTIAVLDDDNVWMTKNLNIGSNPQKFITARDSDIEAGTTVILPESSSLFDSGNYRKAQIYNTVANGGYYSYAAVIPEDVYVNESYKIFISSICPKGWDLPNSYQYDDLKGKANLDSTTALSAPYNFISAGYLYGSTINSGIRLWTSTNDYYNRAYYSGAYSMATASSNYKNYGESVRCIKSNGNATIVYHGNGDSIYPVDSPNEIQKSEPINSYRVEDVKFNRVSWSFNGWNTQPDGSGNNIAVGGVISSLGLSEGDTLDLYAKWVPNLKIVYHSNNVNDETKTVYAKTGTTYKTGNANYFEEGNKRIVSWNTSSDGTGTSYTVNTNYTAPSGMVTPSTLDLYAQWETTYEITYNGNGSDGDDVLLMESVGHTVLSGESITLYASNYSKVGYGFAGWSFDQNAINDLANATIYGPNETITAPSYSANGRTLYAVWIAADQTDTFQSFAVNKRCDSMSTGDMLALTDERDDNVYTVAKLTDGNCWMTENLRLVLGAAGTDGDGKTIVGAVSAVDGSVTALDSINTNNPAKKFLHNNALYDDWYPYTSGDEKINFGKANIDRNQKASYNDVERYGWGIHQESSWYAYGVMYNWYTATAGRGLISSDDYTNAVSGDICPSGWHLARGTNSGELYNLNANVSSLTTFPNNFVFSGEYYTNGDQESYDSSSANHTVVYSAAKERGQRGYYWLSNPIESSSANKRYASGFQVNNYGTSGLDSETRVRGLAVRCLASESKDYTLQYNANGGSNAPDDDVILDTATGIFTVSNTVPTRTGFTFNGWVSEDGDEYEAGDTIAIPYNTDTATLYAKWTNNACNPSATDIDDAVCLQDMNSDVKASMDFKETYTLIDARDNKEYTVAVLDDRNVWMTKNLGLSFSESRLLISNDTDLPDGEVAVIPGSVQSFSSNKTFQHLVDTTYGVFYNFYLAALNPLGQSTGTVSICPKGWDLPTRTQYNDLQLLSGVDTTAKAQASPYYFEQAGYINNSTRTSGISLWTPEVYRYSGYAYTSKATEQITDGSPNSVNNSMYYGRSVRCTMNNGTVTIHYDANGGTGTMNDQVDVSASTGLVSINRFGVPNSHKQFREWNTKADGTGIAVKPNMAISSIGVSDGDTVNLYAQWDDVYILTFVNTATGATQTKNVVVGESGTVYPTSSWARSGYYLSGWDINSAGETIVYTNYQSITPQSDIVVYTVWKQYYKIIYDINTDDVNAEGIMSNTHTVHEGGVQTLYSGNFKRPNYGFLGWSFDPDAASDLENATVYGPNESIAFPAYTADTVSLYAVWIPSDGNLQSFNCNSLSAGGVTALTDTRDGDTYAVAKLEDGKCWMIENLRLDSTADSSLMVTDSQGLGNGFTALPASSRNWGTTVAALRLNSDNTDLTLSPNYSTSSSTTAYSWYSYGNYYSWASVIADTSSYGNDQTVTGTSICPKGWRLPTGGTTTVLSNDYYQLIYATTGIDGNYNTSNNRSLIYSALRSYPNNFVQSGTIQNNYFSNRGNYMYYWTSTSSSSSYAYIFGYASSNLYPGNGTMAKYYGGTVRCLKD